MARLSAARMRVSPIRTASTPAASRRATSSRVSTPDSDTKTRPSPTIGRRSMLRPKSTWKVHRSRLLTPTTRAPAAMARGTSSGS